MKQLCFFKAAMLAFSVILLGSFSAVTYAASSFEWPRALSVSSPSKGPKYFAPLAFSGVLEEKTGMKVRVTPGDVHAQRLKWFKMKDFEIFVQGAGGPLFFMEARNEYAAKGSGPLPITVMWPATIEAFAPMLRGDTKYRTINDLKRGVTFAAPPGATPRQNIFGVAAWAGLQRDDWKMNEFGSMDAAVKAIPDGKADIVWWIPDAGNTFEAETAPRGLHWLDLDPESNPEAAARATEVCPNWMFGKAPATAVKSAQGMNLVLVPTYFFVLEDQDDDLVYNLVKFIDENVDAMKEKHGSAATMNINSFRSVLDQSFIPLHRATIKYLKEKGMWTAADDKRQAYNKNLFNRYIQAFDAALKEADNKGERATPKNEDWLKIWKKHKQDIPRIKAMLEIP